VIENGKYKLLFDRAIVTDRTIHHNRPDIVLVQKQEKRAYLIDIAVPNTNGIQRTYAEKVSKYTDLAGEVKKLWHLKRVEIIPLVLSSTGVIPKTLLPNLEKLGLRGELRELMQRCSILNTCNIVRKFLN